MSGEFDFYGVFVPRLLVLMLAAFVVTTCIRVVLTGLGFYRVVWHRSLFNLSLYVIVLGAVVAMLPGLPS